MTVYSRLAERFDPADFVYAHRGLWMPAGPPENSQAAFRAAAQNGLGIEFDVRPSADGVPVIFHDPALDRMTHAIGEVAAHTSDELQTFDLIGGGQILRLAELLEFWPGETPLLCEIKIDGDTPPDTFAKEVANLLMAHAGPAAIMSFSIDAVAAVPDTLMRGQLVPPSRLITDDELKKVTSLPADYYACHVSDAQNPVLQDARIRRPLLTWTVKDEATCKSLSGATDSQIFEGFDPKLAKRHILNR
ncbi:MAG: glycerophosphodiester phosphodiesterase family protein [Pseudomonadota bacterium]